MTKKLSFVTFGTLSLGLASILTGIQAANATSFTTTSPTSGGALDASFSEVGGIVLDIIGTNGTRVTSQTAASSLFTGFAANNPFEIGTQTGFDSSITSVLGGGIQEVAVRFSLFDGDNAAFDFDDNENALLLNGVDFGNWSDVEAQNTDGMGSLASGGFSGGGFRNGLLDTGWFFNNDATTLSNFYTSLIAQEEVKFELDDVDPGDNLYDFTQGIDSSQIGVGQGPGVTPPTTNTVPEPASILGLLFVGGLGANSLKRKKSS